ncbi:MAG: M23 family metallopeptidase [Clostridia bacterium]
MKIKIKNIFEKKREVKYIKNNIQNLANQKNKQNKRMGSEFVLKKNQSDTEEVPTSSKLSSKSRSNGPIKSNLGVKKIYFGDGKKVKKNMRVKLVKNRCIVKVLEENLDCSCGSKKSDMKRKRKGNKNVDFKKSCLKNLFLNKNRISKSYYLLLIAMVILGGTSVVIATKAYNLFEKENYLTYASTKDIPVSSNIDTTIQSPNAPVESSSEVNNKDTKNIAKTNETKVIARKEDAKVKTVPIKIKEAPKIQPLKFSKPIQGEVQKIYSIDKVIYSKTLELWKTHDGIDIKGEIGQNVKAIEKGIVQKVYEDSFYGTTVVIDHGQGYKSSYSNLANATNVSQKQNVVKGQILGKISNTAIGEIKDEPHLHFMLYKNNQIIDPSSIFN